MHFFRRHQNSLFNNANKASLSALAFLLTFANAQENTTEPLSASQNESISSHSLHVSPVTITATAFVAVMALGISVLLCARCSQQREQGSDGETRRINARTEVRKADQRAGLNV